MSIVFTPYQPAFVDSSRRRPSWIVDSLEQLLGSHLFRRFSSLPDFYRFEFAADLPNGIMATYADGYVWYVVGKVDKPLTELPIWQAKYREGARP